MAIKLNDSKIKHFKINNKNVNRIMLNDIQIWPEEINDNELELTIHYKSNSRAYFCIDCLHFFGDDYTEIVFDKIDMMGNPLGEKDPYNVETVLSNDDTELEIKHNMGAYKYGTGQIPAEIPLSTSGITQATRNDTYAWLPDPVGKPMYMGDNTYLGYRYFITKSNIPVNTDFTLKFNSDGKKLVKYVSMSFGYLTLGNAQSEIHGITFKGNEHISYENVTEFKSGEVGSTNDERTTAKRVHIFGTDGSVYTAWTKFDSINGTTSEILNTMYLIHKYYFKGHEDAGCSVYKVATLEEVILDSDGNGYVHHCYDVGSEINFKIGKTFSSTAGHKYVNLSGLVLYDEDYKLMIDEHTTWDFYSLSNLGAPTYPYATTFGLFRDTEEIDGVREKVGEPIAISGFKNDYSYYSETSKYYTPLSALAVQDLHPMSLGSAYALEITNNNVTYGGNLCNWTYLTSKKVKYVGIAHVRVDCYGKRNQFENKVQVNDVKLSDELANATELVNYSVKTVDGLIYVLRYYIDLDTNEVYESWARAYADTGLLSDWRQIYVYAKDVQKMTKIDLEELVTGNYPHGEYNYLNTDDLIYTYEFSLSGSLRSTACNYVALGGMKVADREGNVYKFKELLTPINTTNTMSEASATMLLEDDSTLNITNNCGGYSNVYPIHKVLNVDPTNASSYNCWISNTITTSALNVDYRVKITTDKPDRIIFLFNYWNYPYNATAASRGYAYCICNYTKYVNNDYVINDFHQEGYEEGTFTTPTMSNSTAGYSYAKGRCHRTVKGKVYDRIIMATTEKAYVCYVEDAWLYMLNNDEIGQLYKYNKEYDVMLPYSIGDIIDNDMVSEYIDVEHYDNLINLQFIPKMTWQTTNYFGICNGMVWVEDEENEEEFRLLNPDEIIASDYYKRLAVRNAIDEDEILWNNKQRFTVKDSDIEFELATDTGTYNTVGSYILQHVFTPNDATNKGALTMYPFSGNDLTRKFNINFRFNKGVKAIALQLFYSGGSNSSSLGYPYAIPGGLYHNDNKIYDDLTTNALAKAWWVNEGLYKKIVLFPDRNEAIVARTTGNKTVQTGILHEPLYLWNRRTYSNVEYSIKELYNLDKETTKYDQYTASIDPILEEANRMEFLLARTWNLNNTTYGAVGNCLMIDEDDNVIFLTHTSTTRVPTTDDISNNYASIAYWEDEEGNVYELETTAQFRDDSYTLDKTFTPPVLVPSGTTSSYNNWLTRNSINTTVGSDGEPVKWFTFNIIARNKKIKAIAISDASYGNTIYNGGHFGYVEYVLPEEHQYEETVEAGNEEENTTTLIERKTVWRHPTLNDRTNNMLYTINNQQWIKRIIVREDGKMYTTWIPVNFKFVYQ